MYKLYIPHTYFNAHIYLQIHECPVLTQTIEVWEFVNNELSAIVNLYTNTMGEGGGRVLL